MQSLLQAQNAALQDTVAHLEGTVKELDSQNIKVTSELDALKAQAASEAAQAGQGQAALQKRVADLGTQLDSERMQARVSLPTRRQKKYKSSARGGNL
jgi:predicted  nucleic acid-binding Zn-ribbon protein